MSEVRAKSGRHFYLDVIRLISILSIVMVHISAYIVIFYPDPSKTEFVIGNVFNGLARAGVPLFIMLSGALLLKEDKLFEAKRFYKTSLLWLIYLLIGWLIAYGVFYACILPIMTGNTPKWDAFMGFILTFKGSEYPHLWYMFMIVGGYLTIPVLRLFVKRENRRYIFWMIIGSMVFQFAVTTADVFVRGDAMISASDFLRKFHLEPVTGFIGYFLLGWYLSTFEIKKHWRICLYVAAATALVCSILTVRYGISSLPTIRNYVYQEVTLPAFLYGTGVFVTVKALCGEKTTESPLLLCLMTDSFGIYIIHVAYLELFMNIWLPYDKAPMGVLQYILFSFCVVFGLSWLTVWMVSKIPHIKKIFYIK